MKLIDRYLVAKLLVPLAVCLAAFVMIYVVYDLFDTLPIFIEASTSWSGIFRYFVYLIPSVLILIVPIAMLLAVLYALSQLAKNNELTAMRASGVSLYRLLVPYAIIGFLLSLAVLYVNEEIGPEFAFRAKHFKDNEEHKERRDVNVVRNHPLKNERADRIWLVEEFNVLTYDMKGILLTQEREDGSYEVEYTAESGQWMDEEWVFHDVSIQRYDQWSNPRGAPTTMEHMVMHFLDETPKDFLNEIKYNHEFMSAREIAQFVETRPNLSRETVVRYRTDFHYRLAMPWTCFVATLLGIPLGSATGRKGAFFGVFMSISLFFTYYVCIMLFLAIGKKGAVDPWLAGWLPNAVFFSLGLGWAWRMR